MSSVRRDICDYCGKETSDRYASEGWVRVKGSPPDTRFQLTISIGREESGTAHTVFFEAMVQDFCCLDCYFDYLQDKIEESEWEMVEE